VHAGAGGGIAGGDGKNREEAGVVSGSMHTRRAPWLTAYACFVYAFIYLPILVLIAYSFSGSGVGGFPPKDWTLLWYRVLFDDGALWASVLNSMEVALAAVVISLGLGLPAALALDRSDFPGKAAFRRLVLLPLILPGIITGLSLLMLFVAGGINLGLLTITLGHGTALISVATTEIFAGLQKFERVQEEASLDLGANHWRTFWRVTFPNLRVSLIAAGLLIFTLSLDEIAVSFFLIGRDNTLPLEIWSRLRRGITPEINAISTLILLFSIGLIVIWYRLRTRGERAPAEAAMPLEPAVEQRAP
jgi:spermidine/putrescine transport system permease protein